MRAVRETSRERPVNAVPGRNPRYGRQSFSSGAYASRSVFSPPDPKSILTLVFSATPSTDTTVPRPNASCVTRSPGASDGTARPPLFLGAAAADAGSRRVVAAVQADFSGSVRHSISLAGTSLTNREAGLNEGAPHELRTAARVS